MGVFPIIAIFIAMLVGAPILFLLFARGDGAAAGASPRAGAASTPVAGQRPTSGGPGARPVGDDARLQDAARRLAQNPRDVKALSILAEAALQSGNYEAARQRYKRLLDLCAGEPRLDEVAIALRHGVAAFRAGALEEARKSLLFAHAKKPFAFEPNNTLGCLESARGNHEKAAGYFNRAHQADPDNISSTRRLGESLFALGHHHDSIPLLRRVYEQMPGDSAVLFKLGQAYAKTGKTDTAARIFTRLRTAPSLGPRAALLSSLLQLEQRQYDRAIEDLEIGLRHRGTDAATVLELKYRLGGAWLRKGDIARALVPWKEIAAAAPAYRDVPDLLARYQEVSSNARLKAYMLSPTSEFVTLCRRLCVHIVAKARTKILSVALHKSESVDITAEVDAGARHEVVLYRFVRASGVISEPALRDMYAKTREIKAGRGVCIAPAAFSPSAKTFAEGRVLDTVDKQGLLTLLARIQWAQA